MFSHVRFLSCLSVHAHSLPGLLQERPSYREMAPMVDKQKGSGHHAWTVSSLHSLSEASTQKGGSGSKSGYSCYIYFSFIYPPGPGKLHGQKQCTPFKVTLAKHLNYHARCTDFYKILCLQDRFNSLWQQILEKDSHSDALKMKSTYRYSSRLSS